MTTQQQQNPDMHAETESSIADLMPYIKAAQNRFPSKEALFAEVNKERDGRKKRLKALQYTSAFIFCALGIWAVNPTISSKTYTTNYAQHDSISLSDGSTVQLNANSTLTANYRLRSREIYLEKGEASFTVKHALRPFTVAINTSIVLDIGTVFNIAKWDQSFIATVMEGEVELQTGDNKTRLVTGQSVKVTQLEVGSPYRASMDEVTAWQTGKILFNKTSLKDAINSIQRYREAPIALDPRLENMLITGIYEISKIEQLLDSMDSMFPVKVTRLDQGEIKIQKK
ncbi:FecR family protein [Methylophilus rhizosphaerae]|uniref:FecR family protein n=1 Tax=Methylophilus rhizosphaerae TaxID=492660 RepID=A0A1G9CQN5_9PROT|nr:FecR domain-containing protein [Methylophilus rhizosphaerae]SDK53980.1 FecR family protein [Methylophilus rhizosphaerae]